MLHFEPTAPKGVSAEDWGPCHEFWNERSFVTVDQLDDFGTYPWMQVLPSKRGMRGTDLRKLRASLGYRFIDSPDYLKRYGDFYGYWLLPDGRIAKHNSWMTQLTIYPIDCATHVGHTKSVKSKKVE